MRLHVVYDAKGKIIAAGRADPVSGLRSNTTLAGAPANVGQGHRAAELDVPESHAQVSLKELIEQLEVDHSGSHASLRVKK
jgi:hypothetical protein